MFDNEDHLKRALALVQRVQRNVDEGAVLNHEEAQMLSAIRKAAADTRARLVVRIVDAHERGGQKIAALTFALSATRVHQIMRNEREKCPINA